MLNNISLFSPYSDVGDPTALGKVLNMAPNKAHEYIDELGKFAKPHIGLGNVQIVDHKPVTFTSTSSYDAEMQYAVADGATPLGIRCKGTIDLSSKANVYANIFKAIDRDHLNAHEAAGIIHGIISQLQTYYTTETPHASLTELANAFLNNDRMTIVSYRGKAWEGPTETRNDAAIKREQEFKQSTTRSVAFVPGMENAGDDYRLQVHWKYFVEALGGNEAHARKMAAELQRHYVPEHGAMIRLVDNKPRIFLQWNEQAQGRITILGGKPLILRDQMEFELHDFSPKELMYQKLLGFIDKNGLDYLDAEAVTRSLHEYAKTIEDYFEHHGVAYRSYAAVAHFREDIEPLIKAFARSDVGTINDYRTKARMTDLKDHTAATFGGMVRGATRRADAEVKHASAVDMATEGRSADIVPFKKG